MTHFRDGKRLGKKHGRWNEDRRNKKRNTSNWECPHCGFRTRGGPKEVDRTRAAHACPAIVGMPDDSSPGGMTWHA